MNDPFDILRDQLVRAAERTPARAGRRRQWRLLWRRHPVALVAAALVLSGSATAAVVSLSSRSAPLTGRVPPVRGPTSPRSLAGLRYEITIFPYIEAGQFGWCTNITYSRHGKPEFGSGGCGDGPSADRPLFGDIFSSDLSPPPGDRVSYVIPAPRVAAVRIEQGPTIAARPDARLPFGLKAVVILEPALSPPLAIPPPGSTVAAPLPPPPGPDTGRPPAAIHPRALIALDRSGRPLVTGMHPRAPRRLPTRFWQVPQPPARGACAIGARLPGLRAMWGSVLTRVPSLRGLDGPAFLSCVDTEYYLGRSALKAAILLNARHPGKPAAPLPNAAPARGEPGVVNVRAGSQGDLSARRAGNAWLVVQGGTDVKQRLQVLRALTVAKIKLGGSAG